MRAGLIVAVYGFVFLAGCSGGSFSGSNQTQAAQAGSAGAKLTGVVHGGQQPISGAHVYLFAASATGYGGAGIAASSSNASVSLLTSGTVDTSGGATNGDYYVTSDSSGNFSITGDYTCAAGQQVYLYALGGNPGLGSGVNPVAGLMAVLGNCPVAGTFSSSQYVVVNEVSTIAAAYSFAGFATDALHVGSSGTALAQVGIANAFANAAHIAVLSTGWPLGQPRPGFGGTGTPSEVDTLGNILAACVNSSGAVTGPANATPCYTLFTSTLSGGTTGTQPTDTATAAINIAHNPVTNIAPLFSLVPSTPPFPDGLFSAPSNFLIVFNFSGGGLFVPEGVAIDGAGSVWVASRGLAVVKFSSAGAVLSGANGFTGGGQAEPYGIAIDSSGNAWVANQNNNSVTELSNSGAILSGTNGYTGGGLNEPFGIAIDGSDNVWVTNRMSNSVTEISNSGTFLSGAGGYTGGGMTDPFSIAIDSSGNAWITSDYTGLITELSNTGAVLSGATGYTGGGLKGSEGIAIDGLGNAWATNSYYANGVIELSSSGAIMSGATGYNGNGLSGPYGIAVDGGGNVWVSNPFIDVVVELSNSGTFLSGSKGYTVGNQAGVHGIAIDGSGNVWLAGDSIQEVVGAGVPVVTPLAVGVKNGMLGTRP